MKSKEEGIKMIVLALWTADFRMEGRSYFHDVVSRPSQHGEWKHWNVTNLGRKMVESLLWFVNWVDAVEMDEALQQHYEDEWFSRRIRNTRLIDTLGHFHCRPVFFCPNFSSHVFQRRVVQWAGFYSFICREKYWLAEVRRTKHWIKLARKIEKR